MIVLLALVFMSSCYTIIQGHDVDRLENEAIVEHTKMNGLQDEVVDLKKKVKKLEQEITKKCKKFKEKNNGKEFLINGLEWSIHLNNFHATSSLKQKPIISVYKL